MPEETTLPSNWFPIFTSHITQHTHTVSNTCTTNNDNHCTTSTISNNVSTLSKGDTASAILTDNRNNFSNATNTIQNTKSHGHHNATSPNRTTSTIAHSYPSPNPEGIIISESAIHGSGAFFTRPLKKGRLGRYAPDVEPITTDEADQLPHEHQDYLVKIKLDGQEVFLNGDESKDFSVFINHSWGAANVEIDEAGYLHVIKNIRFASIEKPVELLLNYGHLYWWDKLLT